ncbi:hypothetical protein COCOR_00969 [Corallococcus coralloides DSM 2259]|uniref:Type 4 fimbrial biogenesis protein PilX N-terminal domain-containing protein n=1 Tax=Corallococcus coralloides (strain ATCC 25202 / DSM 2259 / NBRC 100086 / M2) TaxID=1144275 RepID=H8MLI7_CORCM|nr:hypothetical protein [Corallococcus coralloides]AFE03813.1 hypothetical protein COCOR_00969 [Corallococcus coralloides DSM 2259]
MVRRPTPRRQSRGFTLLLALGVVAVVTMAVMLSFSVVGREADTQADTRRQKQAFFAAEAGLAEGRETVRLLLNNNGNNSTMGLSAALGGVAPVADIPALAAANPPWYELLPGPEGGWNPYTVTTANLSPSEIPVGVDYPEQRNVRYRVFVRDDLDDDQNTVDSNRQLWILAVGEVTMEEGRRPTRSMVQALVTNAIGESIFAPGCITKGCGPDMTYNNPTDQKAPAGTTITLP